MIFLNLKNQPCTRDVCHKNSKENRLSFSQNYIKENRSTPRYKTDETKKSKNRVPTIKIRFL